MVTLPLAGLPPGARKVVQVGIRAQCEEEADFIREKKITTLYAHQIRRRSQRNPGMVAQFVFKLAGAPPGIAEEGADDPANGSSDRLAFGQHRRGNPGIFAQHQGDGFAQGQPIEDH